jgi:hypothetical protein
MSQITLNVLEAERVIHLRVHGSIGDAVVAALAADPATIDELDVALGRCRKKPAGHFFRDWNEGLCDQPWDAGRMYVDLAARLVACESSYSQPAVHGTIDWHDGSSVTEIRLKYDLAPDWRITDDVDSFRAESSTRRRQRRAPSLDERLVLYERLPEYVASQLHQRRDQLPTLDRDGSYQLVKQLHADWLLTPREDLRGASPRAVMLDRRHDHINTDIRNQERFWSYLRCAPPAIPRQSRAYRFGGFGTHEIVLYYDLARHLFFHCLERLAGRRCGDLSSEIEHLQMERQEWLHAPAEDLDRRTPIQIVDQERMRLPWVLHGEEAICDPDCPLCRMLADESFGPTFCNLDGCNMDWDFAFSLHATRQQWELEELDFQQYMRAADAKSPSLPSHPPQDG